MPGERTPDTSPAGKGGSSDDDISLREHLQRQLDSQVAAIHRRIDQLIDLLDERYEVQKADALRVAKEAQEALDKAERATEKRFDSVNEFRAQLNDQAHTFMPRTESISRHERTQEQLATIESHLATAIATINRRLDRAEGADQGQAIQRTEGRTAVTDVRAWLAFGVTLLLAAITIAAFVIANSGKG